MSYTCRGCTNTWTGLSQAHCSGCHRTFSTAGLFDRHRRAGGCVDPATITEHGIPLVLDEGTWRYPDTRPEALRAHRDALPPAPEHTATGVTTPANVRRSRRIEMVDRYRRGDRVRTNTPRSPKHHDQVGTVVGLNLGEVGLTFQPVSNPGSSATVDAWFLPSELTHEPTR